MDVQWQIDLPPTPDAGRAARDAVAERFAGRLTPRALEDVQIVATELIAYGLQTDSAFLRLRGWIDTGSVCLEVSGGDGRAAVLLPQALDDAAAGWGPRLIATLAEAWETRSGPSVWVRLHDPHSVASMSVREDDTPVQR